MTKIVHDAIENCVHLANNNSKEITEKVSTPPYNIIGHNPIYHYVAHCMSTSIFINCPKSVEAKSKFFL